MNTLNNKEFNTLLYITKLYTSHNLDNKKLIAEKLFFELKTKIDANMTNKKLLSELKNGHYKEQFIKIFIMNTTYFFRNAYHFLDIQYRIIEAYNMGKKDFNVLCLPCSSGEEAYSLAICLYFLNKKLNNKLNINIIACDIDTAVLNYAQIGEYSTDIFAHFPKYLDINISEVFEPVTSSCVKIKQNIKTMITFKNQDLSKLTTLDLASIDFIFSRNVWFYFDNQSVYDMQNNMYNNMTSKTFVYVGIGEKFVKFDNIKRLGMGIYQKL